MNIDPDELYKWIDSHTISRPKRNLNRDFSDAVPLAEMLKQHFPRLVELHNYTPTHSFSQKLVNWDVMNKRVLNKLNINLTKKTKEDLGKGTPGAIERLLEEIKIKIEDREASGDHDDDTKILYLENGLEFSSREGVLPIKINDGSTTVDKKLVPSDVYDKMEKDIEEQKETISVLSTKVDHLEKLLSIKDERIKDLTQQLQSIINQPGGSPSGILSPKTRFFSNLF